MFGNKLWLQSFGKGLLVPLLDSFVVESNQASVVPICSNNLRRSQTQEDASTISPLHTFALPVKNINREQISIILGLSEVVNIF